MVGFAMVLVTMFVVQNLVRSKQGRAITAKMCIRDSQCPFYEMKSIKY